MDHAFYQACFTRVGGNSATAGWQLVSCSPDIPVQLSSFFESAEKGVQTPEVPLDAEGRPLCMLDLISGGGQAGLVRVQYGLADSFGRSSMFCHGFLFPDSLELLKHPENLLGIKDENFHFTAEETAVIPEQLAMEPAGDLDAALAFCGMGDREYGIFVRCAYTALSSRARSTVFVKTDGDDRKARCLLYLLLSALPWSMRTRVTACTSPEMPVSSRMFIFVQTPPAGVRWVEPATGENNILTAPLEARWRRNPFVADFVTRRRSMTAEEADAYWQGYDTWLARMGDRTITDMEALNLAWNMEYGEKTPDRIPGLLCDWLALPLPGCGEMEEETAVLLNQVTEEGLLLPPETENLLRERTRVCTSEALKTAYRKYLSLRLSRTGEEETVEVLTGMREDPVLFREVAADLRREPGGAEHLLPFYEQLVRKTVMEPDCSFQVLLGLRDETRDLPDARRLLPDLEEGCFRAAERALASGEPVFQVLEEYEDTLHQISPSARSRSVALEDAFYQMFLQALQPERMEEYANFFDRCRRYQDGDRFMDALGDAASGSWHRVGNWLMGAAGKKEWRDHAALLIRYAMEEGAPETCQDIWFWAAAAKCQETGTVTFMVRHRATLLLDPVRLEYSTGHDPFWLKRDNLERFTQLLSRYVEEGGDQASSLKDSLGVLKSACSRREEEKRQAEKEERRREKAEQRQQRRDRAAGFLGGLLGRDQEEPEPGENAGEQPQEPPQKGKKQKPPAEDAGLGVVLPGDREGGRRGRFFRKDR